MTFRCEKLPRSVRRFAAIAGLTFLTAHALCGAELADASAKLVRGSYAEVIDAAKSAIPADPQNENWRLLLCDALMKSGRYADAREAITKALEEFKYSIRLRLAAAEIFRLNGDPAKAKDLISEIDRLSSWREWSYRDPENRIALGRAALLVGADPKRVLELFFEPVKKEHPELREVWLASGELALGKGDDALAAKFFGEAAKRFPDDADVQFGLARAFDSGNTRAMLAALEKTLAANPDHVGAHLLLAEHHIDSERYAEAEEATAEALKVDPARPEAHALRSVLAELRADAKTAKAEREAALKLWPTNPAVDQLIGRKLAQKYRFAEAAERQRQALKFDPDFIPAKIELAQALLRLGENDEGWKLAEEVQTADPYDVVAFNLVTLRDSVAHFETLTSEHFLVRMEPREAAIYGQQALALLERAFTTLGKKYGLEPKQRTVVEIFPEQKDFAIRTFGLPGGAGYLGVCFGRVITANSPAARPDANANWQAVLWHEYCHVVTLQLTRNKMPRWLSEGISVYEERQARSSANPSSTWGEKMTPRYRAMILGEDLTPVSQLSGAFLKPKTPAHLQFAYFESSLVVDWLVGKFGIEKLKRTLADLGRGVEINAALAANFEPIDKLDADFAEHARQIASGTAPKLDWKKPEATELASDAGLERFIAENPDNFTALTELARKQIKARNWAAAKAPLQKLVELYPGQHDADGAWAMLARVHRELGEADAELTALNRLAALSADAVDAFARLAELAVARKDWPVVLTNAERLAAVNPLTPQPHRLEAEADEALGKPQAAIAAYTRLLRLDPPDAPDVHYRLAKLLHAARDPSAKQHLLLALEEAPRFRAALDLLLKMSGEVQGGKPPSISQ